jgi:hypothetical protein
VTLLNQGVKHLLDMPPTKRAPKSKIAQSYLHPDADSPMRPEVGTQAQFKKKTREVGEALLKEIADCRLRLSELRGNELRVVKGLKEAGK